MEEKLLIKYLRDIVDLETKKRIAGNTYNRLLVAEKKYAYVYDESRKENYKEPSVIKNIEWGSLFKGLVVHGFLFCCVTTLGVLLVKWTLVFLLMMISGHYVSDDEAETIAFIIGWIAIIVWGIWYIRKAVAKAQNRVETEKSSQANYQANVVKGRKMLARIQQDKPELKSVYFQCEKNLEKLYALNIIHQNYRYLEACGMFLQYLSTGRTHSLEQRGGDPGAYNLYENDLKYKVIKRQLDQVLENQKVLYGVLNKISNDVDSLCASVERIERYAGQTAENTRISTWCNMATAANTYAIRRMQEEYQYYR